MYKLIQCSKVSDNIIFDTFKEGFSDYIIKVEMSKKQFIDRFFGPEGNQRKYSCIAYKGDIPVGIILSGIREGLEYKTLRCGGFAVIPSERGSEVSKKLFEYHLNLAKTLDCKQLCLEVIEGNDRAINFYLKNKYKIVYSLFYRSWKTSDKLKLQKQINYNIEITTHDILEKYHKKENSYLPWQADFPYFKNIECNYYIIKDNDIILGGLVASGDKILYLWVDPKYRNQGIATNLINRMVIDNNIDEIQIMHSNNYLINSFCEKHGMTLKEIKQYEMFRWI